MGCGPEHGPRARDGEYEAEGRGEEARRCSSLTWRPLLVPYRNARPFACHWKKSKHANAQQREEHPLLQQHLCRPSPRGRKAQQQERPRLLSLQQQPLQQQQQEAQPPPPLTSPRAARSSHRAQTHSAVPALEVRKTTKMPCFNVRLLCLLKVRGRDKGRTWRWVRDKGRREGRAKGMRTKR